MSTAVTLLAAVAARPADLTPREAYADYLEDHDQPVRAAFVRRHAGRQAGDVYRDPDLGAQLPGFVRDADAGRLRGGLVAFRPADDEVALGPDTVYLKFRRGLGVAARVPDRMVVSHLPRVFSAHPVAHVLLFRTSTVTPTPTDPAGYAAHLAARGVLDRPPVPGEAVRATFETTGPVFRLFDVDDPVSQGPITPDLIKAALPPEVWPYLSAAHLGRSLTVGPGAARSLVSFACVAYARAAAGYPPTPPRRVTLPDVVDRFRTYHARPGNAVWGPLHVVLEDGNLEDASVLFCKREALAAGDAEGAELADVLLRLSKTQRARIGSAARTR